MPERNLRKRTAEPKSKPSKKQRKTKPLQLQAEEAQIFRVFLPNNDIATARRKRIEKAQEYGARWAKEWSEEVTHIICDANILLSEVRKAVEPDIIKSDVIVLNENYPPECIRFHALLSTNLTRFQLKSGDIEVGAGGTRGGVAHSPTEVPKALQNGNDTAKDSSHDKRERRHISVNEECIADGSSDRVAKAAVQDHEETPDKDALDEIVSEVRTIADLPLDSDDESSDPCSRHELPASEQLQASAKQTKHSETSLPRPADKQGRFSCMLKNEAADIKSNPNCRTIETLGKMAHYYDRTGDQWRTMAYRKCITALKKQSEYIKSREQAIKVPGIGERLADKIEEIAVTNRLRRLESTDLDPTDQLLQLFMGIYQVGHPTASRWIAQGHKTFEDLRLRGNLTTNQRIGVDHYDDFLARIPRSEVAAHAAIVRKACTEADSAIQVIISGSYRRGAADSGDIDLIITKENATLASIRTLLTGTVIPELFDTDFLKAGLATSSSRSSEAEGSKWHGASALPGSKVWRRIDLLFVPGDELGAALLYFTGNDVFNRSIRLLARKSGMRLNQHGLYTDVMRGEGSKRITDGTLLESKSEERIFELLGVTWRPPAHRIC